MFCGLSQIYRQLFEKMVYASYSKLSKEFRNGIAISVGQTGLKLWIKTVKLLFGSISQEPPGLPKIWCHFWISCTFYYKMHILFFKKVSIILRQSTNHFLRFSDVVLKREKDEMHKKFVLSAYSINWLIWCNSFPLECRFCPTFTSSTFSFLWRIVMTVSMAITGINKSKL